MSHDTPYTFRCNQTQNLNYVFDNCGCTNAAAFAHLVQGLMNAGVSVVGSVLNDVPAKKPKKEKDQ